MSRHDDQDRAQEDQALAMLADIQGQLHHFREHLNHFHDHLKSINGKLDSILGHQAQNQEIIMSALTDALDLAEANAAKETDAETAIEALLTDVVKQLKDAAAGADPTILARINAVGQGIADRAARLSAAVVANTPAAPAP